MSKYSDYIKSLKENFKTKFFGEVTNWSNKYFTFNHILDDDNIIVFTKNVKTIKGSPALIVGKNKAIFLKDWLVIGVRNYEIGFDGYAVKLNRNFMKVYTFQNDFEDFIFGDKEDDFESLKEVAISQNDTAVALG